MNVRLYRFRFALKPSVRKHTRGPAWGVCPCSGAGLGWPAVACVPFALLPRKTTNVSPPPGTAAGAALRLESEPRNGKLSHKKRKL
jgi:hypothetical protein